MAITTTHTVSTVPPVFKASLEHSNILIGLLNTIRVYDRPKCIFTFTCDGLRATCENSRVMHGSAILPKHIFRYFDLRVPEIQVKLNLDVLLTCFGNAALESDPMIAITSFHTSGGNSIGEDTTMELLIREEDSALELSVSEGDVETKLDITPEVGGFNLFPDMRPESLTARLQMPSLVFAEMYSEFDMKSEDIGFRVDAESFRIFFNSVGGKSEILVDKNSNRQHELSDSDSAAEQEPVKYEYLFDPKSNGPDDEDGDDEEDEESAPDHHSYLFRLNLVKEMLNSLLISKTTTITTSDTFTAIRFSCLVDQSTNDTAAIEYQMVARANVDGDPYPYVIELPPEMVSAINLNDDSDLPAGADHTTMQFQNMQFGNRTESHPEQLTAPTEAAAGTFPVIRQGTDGTRVIQNGTQVMQRNTGHPDYDDDDAEEEDYFDDEDLGPY
jgi:hypothetical protein